MSYWTYSNKTLVQNWYEDRLAPSQPSKLYPNEVSAREKEDSISCLTSAGVPKPLNVLKRQQKWNTSGVVPNDGFQEKQTINKTEIRYPEQVKKEISNPPSFLDSSGKTYQPLQKTNITSLTHVDRQMPGPPSGFGAVIPKHPESWDQRYFETTYNGLYGEAPKKTKSGSSPQDLATFATTNQVFYNTGKELVGNSAGVSYKPGFLDSLKEKSDLLCAEKMRNSSDPQHNTVIQRMWLPTEDPGVKARVTGNVGSVPKTDNENSLPLGTGDYFSKERKDEPGAYRKIRRDVTTYPDDHARMSLR